MKKTLLLIVSIFSLIFSTVDVFAATTWTETQPAGNTSQKWNALTTSADGQTVLAGIFESRLYLSTNAGVNWTETQPAGNVNGGWHGVAMSSDGQKMIVGNYGARLYISSNRGTSWAETQPAGNVDRDWATVGISDNGQKMLAGVRLGRIYLSSNGGTNWAETQPAGNSDQSWYAAAVSGDGQTLFAGASSGRLYVSTNGGTNWTETQPAGNTNQPWRSIATTSDGSTAFAVVDTGTNVYKTINKGSSWTLSQPAGSTNPFLTSISVSTNAKNVFTVGEHGSTYLSLDSGTTWSEDSFKSSADFGWETGTMSRDGEHFYAGEWIGRLYRGVFAPSSTTSNSSSPSYSPPAAPGCTDSIPQGSVDLFQVNRTGNTAQLFFTPAQNVHQYHVVYGYQQGDERFGVLSQETRNDPGVQSVLIQGLNLQASYWFKVVPVNGCATGNWSNWLNAGKGKKIFYRY